MTKKILNKRYSHSECYSDNLADNMYNTDV